MRKTLLKNTVKTCCVIFCLLIAVHAFEAIVLRMDETFFGENFINVIMEEGTFRGLFYEIIRTDHSGLSLL